jgi:hypothetical protein
MFDTVDTVAKPAASVGIAIEDNVPMPEGGRGGGGGKYPWAQLDIGQSFWVPSDNLKSWQTSCVKAGKVHGRKFICRRFDGAEGKQGVRVWRKA